MLHGTRVLLALAHQRDPDTEYAVAGDEDADWDSTCDECGDETGDCDCRI